MTLPIGGSTGQVAPSKANNGPGQAEFLCCSTFNFSFRYTACYRIRALLMSFTDVVKHYGSELGVEGLKTRYQRFIKPDVQLLTKAVSSGIDARLVKLSCDSNDNQGRIYVYFCSTRSDFL